MWKTVRCSCIHLWLAAVLLVLAPAAQAGELCVDEDYARAFYDTGWQALQAREWPSAFGHLQFFYLLTVNGPLRRDWGFMEELIAAKNHALAQIIALEKENLRLQKLLARVRSESGAASARYFGQKVASPPPPLRRYPPRAR